MRSMISGSIAAPLSSVMPSARTAVSSTCSVAPTLGYGSSILAPCRPVRRRHADAARELVDDRAELAQHLEVVVDRAVADAAAAEVGDERLAEPVQQRPAEQDRDAARAGVRVDVGHVGALDSARVEQQLALVGAVGHLDAVDLEQTADDPHVADVRHIPQHARAFAQQGRDHRLGDEVLGAAHLDSTAERDSAVDRDAVAFEADMSAGGLCVLKK